MGFKQTIKRIGALGAGASMVGATMFGAMAQADLAQYPSQYIDDGKFTGVMVVGDSAAAQDVIGVSDIAVSLQFAATKPAATSGGGTTVTASGEAWKVGTSTKIMELGENLETSAGTLYESIAKIANFQFIDDQELPNLLAPFTANNPKGDAPYDQRLYFEDNSTGYVIYTEDDLDTTADFLYFASGSQLARYELEFTTSLESDIDDSAGSASTTGLFLTDFEDSVLEMLGQRFEIVTAKRTTTVGNNVQLTLMGGAVRDTMQLGTTKTYTIDGKDYEVTLEFVDGDSAKFTVNGETTRDMIDGDTDKLSDGTTIGVSEVLFQDFSGGVHSAEFFLGAQKVELKDSNIADAGSSNSLEVDDEDIDDASVIIEGSDDNTTFKIDRISINMTADDDFFVPAGGKLSENPELSEPEVLFGKGWDIEYVGLNEEAVNEIAINSNGDDDYDLEFVDSRGNTVKVPIAHTPSGSVLKFGDDDNTLVNVENRSIKKDDYLFVSDSTDEDGERSSFALRYRGSDRSTDDNPVLKFDDLGSGERLERTLSVGIGAAGRLGAQQAGSTNITHTAQVGTLKIGGATFSIRNASSHEQSDFPVFVDLNADGSIGNGRVTLNTQHGARIDVINNSAGIIVNVDTPNDDDYDDLAPHAFGYNITAASGELSTSLSTDQAHTYKNPDDEDDSNYAYSSYGALALRTSPSGSPEEVTIWYPQNQRVPQVFITGSGAEFTSTAPAAGGSAVVVQRIDVGATKLASEVANINAVNSILVGGPCANAAAATVMGNPSDCTAGFEPGVGLLQMWEVGSGNVAMLVAGYGAEDTRNAAAVISNYQDHMDTLVGEKVQVTKVNNVLTVAEPSEEEMMDEEEAEEEMDEEMDEEAEE